MSANDVVLETLTEKIRRQDRIIAEQQVELHRLRLTTVGNVLGQLRLREALLLYVGKDADRFMEQITELFNLDVALDVSNSLFVLENAPVSAEVREAICVATNRGMNRW